MGAERRIRFYPAPGVNQGDFPRPPRPIVTKIPKIKEQRPYVRFYRAPGVTEKDVARIERLGRKPL